MADGRWVWVVAPHGYLDEHGRELARLQVGGTRTRCCHRDTRRGDLGVIYRSQRAKDIAYLIRATGDAHYDDDAGWSCPTEVVERLDRPVPIEELRADPVTSTWPALRASFVARTAAVPDAVWRRLMAMAGSRH